MPAQDRWPPWRMVPSLTSRSVRYWAYFGLSFGGFGAPMTMVPVPSAAHHERAKYRHRNVIGPAVGAQHCFMVALFRSLDDLMLTPRSFSRCT
jgi:hypothetical protein